MKSGRLTMLTTVMALGLLCGQQAQAGTIQIETTNGALTALSGTDLVFTEFYSHVGTSSQTRTIDLSSVSGYSGSSFDLTVTPVGNNSGGIYEGDQGLGVGTSIESTLSNIESYRVGAIIPGGGGSTVYWEGLRLTISNLVNLDDVRWNAALFGDGNDGTNGIEDFDLANGEQVTLSGDFSGAIIGDGDAFSFAIPGNPASTAGGLTLRAVNDGNSGWYLRGFTIDATAVPVPEPSTLSLLLISLGCLAMIRRRR